MIKILLSKIQFKISLFFFISLMAAFANAGTGEISGRVTDITDAGIDGIMVRTAAWDGDSFDFSTYKEVPTNPDGTYSITGLDAGDYYVAFVAVGQNYISENYDNLSPIIYFSYATSIDGQTVLQVTDGSVLTADAQLQEGALILGTVVDSDGNPIAGIQVNANTWNDLAGVLQPQRKRITNDSGNYTLGGLSEIEYYISFHDFENGDYIHEGYHEDGNETPYHGDTIDNKTALTPSIGTPIEDIDARLEDAGRISGQVTASDGTTPLANISITGMIWDAANNRLQDIFQRSTDDNGNYSKGSLPPGDDYLYLRFSDYANQLYIEEGYSDEIPFDSSAIGTKIPVSITAGEITTINEKLMLQEDYVCSSNPISISDTQYIADFIQKSEQSITADGDITVKSGVKGSYQAPVITLNPGFHAEAGSQFTASAMSVTCTPELLLRSSSTQALLSTAETEEQLIDIQITQTPEYLIAQWLTAAELPQSLRQLLADKNAIANEIQSDASGNIIVFSSQTALLDNDANGVSDIYAYLIPTDSLSLISHTFDNSSGNGSSTQARINGYGNYIIYRSEADNLNCSSKEDHSDNNNAADIYLYDIAGRQTIRVSWEEDGSQTQHNASNPSIAGNEPYMVYDKDDNFQQQHIYGVDTTVDSLSGIKYSTDYNNFAELIDNSQPGISADGRYVVYLGQSKDENNTCTQHLLDRVTGNSQIILCPDQIAENPEQWFPFFDNQAENVLWQQVK